MIYLDTHIILWLYFGNLQMLSSKVKDLIQKYELYISPIVLLELQYLFESNKIEVMSCRIFDVLKKNIGLEICPKDFTAVIQESTRHHWTRDPFNRVITAQASVDKSKLITRDRGILKHYKHAVWE